MAQKSFHYQDPWKELAARKETRQVELEEVLAGLAVEARTAKELKKALLDRVSRLTRRQ
jgi:hypothetical protein